MSLEINPSHLEDDDLIIISRGGQIYKQDWAQTVIDIQANIDLFRLLSAVDQDSSGYPDFTQTAFPFEFYGGLKIPTDDTYTSAGAVRYNVSSEKVEIHNGTEWGILSRNTVSSDAPPTPASNGDVWYNTDDGRTYIYYNDGLSDQWVEMNPSWNGGIPPLSITPAKISTGGIQWDENGNHSIGGSVDTGVMLDINSAGTGDTGLRIKSDSTFDATIQVNEATTTEYFEFGQSSAENYIVSAAQLPMKIETQANQPLTLKTDSVERVTITGTGEIGLNIITPTESLEAFNDVARVNNTGFDGRGVSIRTDDTTFETIIAASRDDNTDGSTNTTGITFKYGDATTLGTNSTEIVQKVNGTTKVTTDSTGVSVSGDVKVVGSAVGVVLEAPDGGLWRITVDNTGALTTTSV
ncbi:hypothetical protein SCREM2_gp112 [Synechococcus phage S-CREM2]|nr:hypothetical protein SCREM2_gp112 [Synechococcus phage S-CREM2]